ncbi:hypothetical protein CGRA01v4_08426 [Colletotrichum graminicola]|nr:hypothetical protein CGRA01v4_08426 [Colletotrichum graminicola]
MITHRLPVPAPFGEFLPRALADFFDQTATGQSLRPPRSPPALTTVQTFPAFRFVYSTRQETQAQSRNGPELSDLACGGWTTLRSPKASSHGYPPTTSRPRCLAHTPRRARSSGPTSATRAARRRSSQRPAPPATRPWRGSSSGAPASTGASSRSTGSWTSSSSRPRTSGAWRRTTGRCCGSRRRRARPCPTRADGSTPIGRASSRPCRGSTGRSIRSRVWRSTSNACERAARSPCPSSLGEKNSRICLCVCGSCDVVRQFAFDFSFPSVLLGTESVHGNLHFGWDSRYLS